MRLAGGLIVAALVLLLLGAGFFWAREALFGEGGWLDEDSSPAKVKEVQAPPAKEDIKSVPVTDEGALPASVPEGLEVEAPAADTSKSITLSGEELQQIEEDAAHAIAPAVPGHSRAQNVQSSSGSAASSVPAPTSEAKGSGH